MSTLAVHFPDFSPDTINIRPLQTAASLCLDSPSFLGPFPRPAPTERTQPHTTEEAKALNTRISSLLLALAALITLPAAAQTEPFALPSHPGSMVLDLTGFHIAQTSAKPGGTEIGIRAHSTGNLEMLAFLFVTPAKTAQTAATCLRSDVDHLKLDRNMAAFTEKPNPTGSDSPDYAAVLLTYPSGLQYLYRYAGSGDQCLSVEIYADKGTRLDLAQASAVLARQSYDPLKQPDLSDKFTYANILYRTKQYAAAVPIYADLLSAAPQTKPMLTVRRVATDNMGMALGLTGKIDEARNVFLDAIKTDSSYPLFYYNLACDDAEQGNVRDAQVHLRQAFDRRKNVLPGESMPDPTRDDSLLKLKDNGPFWAFVQSLPRS